MIIHFINYLISDKTETNALNSEKIIISSYKVYYKYYSKFIIHNQIEYDTLTDNTNYHCVVTLNFTTFVNIIDSQRFT